MAYQDELKKYTDLVNGFPRFKEMVQRKIAEQNNYNKDLISEQNRLLERQLSLPTELRNEYATSAIKNPLTYENIVQQRASNVGSELGTVNDLLSARQQEQDAIVNAALEAYKTYADTQAQRASASAGSSAYTGNSTTPVAQERFNTGSTGAALGSMEDALDIEIVDDNKPNYTDMATSWSGLNTGARFADRTMNAIDALRRKKPATAWNEVRKGTVELARPGSALGKIAGFDYAFLNDPRTKAYTKNALNTAKDKIMSIFRR